MNYYFAPVVGRAAQVNQSGRLVLTDLPTGLPVCWRAGHQLGSGRRARHLVRALVPKLDTFGVPHLAPSRSPSAGSAADQVRPLAIGLNLLAGADTCAHGQA